MSPVCMSVGTFQKKTQITPGQDCTGLAKWIIDDYYWFARLTYRHDNFIYTRCPSVTIAQNQGNTKQILTAEWIIDSECYFKRTPGPWVNKIYWSTRPTTVPAGSDHYFYTECPSVRPKTSKSRGNHGRPGLWAGRVDHWWLLSCS